MQRLVWPAAVLLTITFISTYMSWEALDAHHWHVCHDDIRYHVVATHFLEALCQGQIPQWMPDSDGGFGDPAFVFWQPGAFLFIALMIVVTGTAGLAVPASVLIMLVLGGLGAYFLARQFTDRATSLFAAAMFLATPYLYIELYIRGDLAEMFAMLLTPWCAWAAARLHSRIASSTREVTGWMAVLAFSLFLVFITHPVVSLFLLPSLAIWVVLQSVLRPGTYNRKFLLHCFGAATVAVVMSCIHWLPAIYMRKYIDYSSTINGFLTPTNHTLWPSQLLSFFWGHGFSIEGPLDRMPFTLGLPHFLLALFGVSLSWRRPAIAIAFALYLALIFMMLHYSNWIWAHVPVLAFVQFPWRLLSVIALFQIICIAGISRLAPPENPPAKYHALLATFVLVTFAAHANIHASTAQRYAVAEGVATFNAQMLYVPGFTASFSSPFAPLTAHPDKIKKGRGDRGLVDDPAFSVTNLPGHSKYHILCSVQAKGGAEQLQINQFYFPGWRVKLDGTDIDDNTLRDRCGPEGLLKIPVPVDAQPHTLEVWYDSPPGFHAYILFACVFSLLVLLLVPRLPYKITAT